MSRRLKAVLCALTVLIALTASFFTMLKKDGWHIDEVATLALANGSQNGYITAYDDEHYGRGAFLHDVLLGDSFGEMIHNIRDLVTDFVQSGFSAADIRAQYLKSMRSTEPVWKSGETFRNYLMADSGFSFRDVYVNQITDAHPPVYYLFVRAAYALYAAFGGVEVTFRPAWAVNALFLAACCLMLIHIGEKRFRSPALGFGAALFFALCPAILSIGTYMRMYTALCFFVLWNLDAHCILREHDYRFSRGITADLMFSCAFGFLTHYYFAIWALCTAAVFGIGMLVRRQGRHVWSYIWRMGLAACCTLIVWPFSVVHLFLSGRGVETAAGITKLGLSDLAAAWKHFSMFAFGKWAFMPLVLLALTMLAVCLNRKREGTPLLLFAVPAVLYLGAIFLIEPYVDIRYMTCAFPLLAVCAAWVFRRLFSRMKNTGVRGVCAACLCGAVAFSGNIGLVPVYSYPGAAQMHSFVDRCEGMSAVYITSGSSNFFREMPDFTHYEKVLILEKEEIPLLTDGTMLEGLDAFVLYVQHEHSATEIVNLLEKTIPFQLTEELAVRHVGLGARAYILSRIPE